jgi:hypothetical protein
VLPALPVLLSCRAFEQELLDAAGGSDEKQLERLRALWHRQLQLPQSTAAELLAEYEAWEASSGKVGATELCLLRDACLDKSCTRFLSQERSCAAATGTAVEQNCGPGRGTCCSLLCYLRSTKR